MPRTPEDQEALSRHRAVIDSIDDQILTLLNQRQEHALAIRQLKERCGEEVFDPQREAAIVERLTKQGPGPLDAEHIEQIYACILKVSKEVAC